jgi:pyrroline-5-carboxylate reductase
MPMTTSSDALKNFTGSLVLAGAARWAARCCPAGSTAASIPGATIIEPHPSSDTHGFVARGVHLNPDFKTIGTADILVLAVKPQMFRDAGPQLRAMVGASTLVVSIMAGTTIAAISDVCGGRVIRAMPNTPAAIGRGITVAVPASDVPSDQSAVADALLRGTGNVEWVDDEALMDAVTAVSGSGPAYVFLLAEEMARAGVAAGLPEALATKLARETVAAPANCCIAPIRPAPRCARMSPRPAARLRLRSRC